MNIDKLTIGQFKEIAPLFASVASATAKNETAFEVGKSYFIRTATYHSVGRLVKVTPNELVLDDASWVADSGRWNHALTTGELEEVEPFEAPVIIFRSGCIDATEWVHPLPRVVK